MKYYIYIDTESANQQSFSQTVDWPTVQAHQLKERIEIYNDRENNDAQYEAFFNRQLKRFEAMKLRCRNLSDGEIKAITTRLNSTSI